MAFPTGAIGALLHELIDDAGLFPPAQLPMPEALVVHRATRGAAHTAIMGRFICPVSRLHELEEALDGDLDGFRLTLLIDTGSDEASIEAALDLARSRPWEVEVAEAKFATGEATESTLHAHIADAALFLEVAIAGSDAGAVAKAIDEIAEAGAGVKFRCGGATADTFPTPDELADGIVTAKAAEVMLKCTAGLHHPFRHLDENDGFVHHGFVNVAVGAVLAHAKGIDVATVSRILATEDGDAFRLGPDEIGWGDLTATEAEVVAARQAFFIGYGSCSIDEPVDDLTALGLMNAGGAA